MIAIIVVLAFFLIKKHNQQPKIKEIINTEKDDITQFIDEIKKVGGRITQKNLRGKFQQYSEAKVSLIITEMENKGIIGKIKKGRGNIIILK
jgi:uncharacterized membrane protein